MFTLHKPRREDGRPPIWEVPYVMAKHYPPSAELETWPPATQMRRTAMIPCPKNIINPPSVLPPFIVLRDGHCLSRHNQAALLAAIDALFALQPVDHERDDTKAITRADTPSLHLGVWEHYSMHPIVSRDTRSQTPEVLLAIRRFMELFKRVVCPLLQNAMETHYPEVWKLQKRYVGRLAASPQALKQLQGARADDQPPRSRSVSEDNAMGRPRASLFLRRYQGGRESDIALRQAGRRLDTDLDDGSRQFQERRHVVPAAETTRSVWTRPGTGSAHQCACSRCRALQWPSRRFDDVYIA